jgi:peptidoglycan hydrolase CwlO-like protein
MNDKFVVSTNEIGEIIVTDVENDRVYRYDDPSNFFGLIRLLNEQQTTIQSLQGDVNRLQYIIDELRKDNYKRFEKINELKAKLREKEEDERLYSNEIVKLNKEAKEVLDFKSLGGDY